VTVTENGDSPDLITVAVPSGANQKLFSRLVAATDWRHGARPIVIVWRLLFLISALLLAAALMARGWFGKRVLAAEGARPCRANPARWRELIAGESPGEIPAEGYGRLVWQAAMVRWKQEDRMAARSREAAKRFGLAVPPLTLVILVFAVALAKLPLFGALAIGLGMTALAVLVGLLSIGAELQAVARFAREVRGRHVFARLEDERAVIACAEATVWLETLPPILRWLA